MSPVTVASGVDIATTRTANRSRSDEPRPITGPLLLTAPEVWELLRTSRKAVYAMVDRRQLPGVTRLGRRLLFRRDVLLDWLGQQGAHRGEEKR